MSVYKMLSNHLILSHDNLISVIYFFLCVAMEFLNKIKNKSHDYLQNSPRKYLKIFIFIAHTIGMHIFQLLINK